jgi:hypothetical protein
MHGINDFFDCADVLNVPGDTHLLKEIHGPLETRELALALRSKEAIALDAQLKRLLWQGEGSGRWRNKGGGSNIGVILMILLRFASPLSTALLLAVLAVARRPTSLLLLLLLLLRALLLVELRVLALVLDRSNAVGIFGVASITTA